MEAAVSVSDDGPALTESKLRAALARLLAATSSALVPSRECEEWIEARKFAREILAETKRP